MNSIIIDYNEVNDNDYYGSIMSSNDVNQQGSHDVDDHLNINYSLSWTGLFGATITVLITTLDDSVWLMPFVAGAAAGGEGGGTRINTCRAIIHVGTFLITLMTLSLLCCIVALAVVRYPDIVFNNSSSLSTERLEIKFEWISVIVCWILAAGFYIKKLLKKRRRRHKQQQQQQQQQQQVVTNESTRILPFENDNDSSLEEEVEESFVVNNNYSNIDHDSPEEEPVTMSTTIRPCTVASLTALGFLDEISYFPTLIVGNIFSITELLLGTFFAGLIVLGIQVFVFHQCKPLMDFLDKNVPLYAIIACFAIILTFHLVWDIVTLPSSP
jgi:ABC-type nickel/cobalt efflux system permease component RcnA